MPVHSNISGWGGASGCCYGSNSIRGNQPGSILGGITVFGSIEHVTTTRAVHRWHIARFDDDNCVLDKRYS